MLTLRNSHFQDFESKMLYIHLIGGAQLYCQPGKGRECPEWSKSLINGGILRTGITCIVRIRTDCNSLAYFHSVAPFLFCNASLFLGGFISLSIYTPFWGSLLCSPVFWCSHCLLQNLFFLFTPTFACSCPLTAINATNRSNICCFIHSHDKHL